MQLGLSLMASYGMAFAGAMGSLPACNCFRQITSVISHQNICAMVLNETSRVSAGMFAGDLAEAAFWRAVKSVTRDWNMQSCSCCKHGAEPWGECLTSCKAAAQTIAGHGEQCCRTDAIYKRGRSGLTANGWKTHGVQCLLDKGS